MTPSYEDELQERQVLALERIADAMSDLVAAIYSLRRGG